MGLDITGLGSIADLASGLVDKFIPAKATVKEKNNFKLGLEQAITARDSVRDEAKKEVMVAEMAQGDNYTKRARPTLVYAGLIFIFLVHVAFPIGFYIASIFAENPPAPPTLTLPPQFWWAWGGVCSVWSIGRSAEKRGVASGVMGKAVNLITGGR